MKIILTGSSGFVATNLYEYVQNSRCGKKQDFLLLDVLRNGEDLTKSKVVDDIWKQYKPDAVINFAAFTHVDDSIQKPRLFWENNLGLQINILEACRKHDCRLLQISSSEVYGTQQYVPMDEKHPLNPHSPYAFTKAAQDRSCFSWFQTYHLDVSIVRPFNMFGPYQQLEKLIPKFIYNIVHGQPLTIYGEGKARRDWLYVKDGVKGIWWALSGLPAGEIVNLATNDSWSVLEVCELLKKIVAQVTGKQSASDIIKVEHVDDRLGHVFHLKGSFEKAKKLLGWHPGFQFSRALNETVKWYIENKFAVPVHRGGRKK